MVPGAYVNTVEDAVLSIVGEIVEPVLDCAVVVVATLVLEVDSELAKSAALVESGRNVNEIASTLVAE